MSGRYSTASYPSLILDQFLFFVQLEHQKKRHFGRIRRLEGNLCIFPQIRGKTNTFFFNQLLDMNIYSSKDTISCFYDAPQKGFVGPRWYAMPLHLLPIYIFFKYYSDIQHAIWYTSLLPPPSVLEFDPDRFLDERLHKYFTPNPFIFLPFNAGPRICLGQQVYILHFFFFFFFLGGGGGVGFAVVQVPALILTNDLCTPPFFLVRLSRSVVLPSPAPPEFLWYLTCFWCTTSWFSTTAGMGGR